MRTGVYPLQGISANLTRKVRGTGLDSVSGGCSISPFNLITLA
jgi:hypothetical protein